MIDVIRFRLAEQGLVDIWLYSFESWGVNRADRCIDEIYSSFVSLSRNPDLGTKADSILKGYRKFIVGSHIIFYYRGSDSIIVSRVLHQEVDLSSTNIGTE